jgi:hypothetical protein
MRGYNAATVAWNTVPSDLQNLDSDLWRNRTYLKQNFQNNGKLLRGPAFPVCLLLNCDTLEDRLKVMSWWKYMGNLRGVEWKRIMTKFAIPTQSGKVLVVAEAAYVKSKNHVESAASSAGRECDKRKRSRSTPQSSSCKRVIDLAVSKEDVIAMIQNIYRQHHDNDKSLLWKHGGFRNGIILLRSSFDCFDRIPVLGGQKVLLVCPQFDSGSNSQCEQFSVYSRLGLRWDAVAMCKSCRYEQKERDAASLHSQGKQVKLEEKCSNYQSTIQKQQRRIKRLEESLSHERHSHRQDMDQMIEILTHQQQQQLVVLQQARQQHYY